MTGTEGEADGIAADDMEALDRATATLAEEIARALADCPRLAEARAAKAEAA